jgi:hypothetical protein
MGFWLVIGFTELLQLVTASKDYALTVLHTSKITLRHNRSSQSVTVFTSLCFVVAFNGGRSPSSGFLNCPWLQLPASHSNSSQLNPSAYLTYRLLFKTQPNSLYGPTTDCRENTVPLLQCNCCLAMAWHFHCCVSSHRHGLHRRHHSCVVYRLLHSNGWLLWLHNSCSEQICHNIYNFRASLLGVT